jgi:hypothetical protein
MGDMRNAYKILVAKPERKRPAKDLGVDGRIIGWIIGWKGMDCIHLAQDRDQWRAVVKTVMKLRISLNAGNFLTG